MKIMVFVDQSKMFEACSLFYVMNHVLYRTCSVPAKKRTLLYHMVDKL
jgi:hypothetical protein